MYINYWGDCENEARQDNVSMQKQILNSSYQYARGVIKNPNAPFFPY